MYTLSPYCLTSIILAKNGLLLMFCIMLVYSKLCSVIVFLGIIFIAYCNPVSIYYTKTTVPVSPLPNNFLFEYLFDIENGFGLDDLDDSGVNGDFDFELLRLGLSDCCFGRLDVL